MEANLETWVDGPGQPSDRVPAAVRAFVGQMQMKAFENVDGWDEEDLDDQGLAAADRDARGRDRGSDPDPRR